MRPDRDRETGQLWFREPENIIQFTKLYGIDQRRLETRQFIQCYALIYGRENEARANSEFAKSRALLAHSDEILMTYDRLRPSERMDSPLTLRVDRSKPGGKFSVLHVPPTFLIGPYNADGLVDLAGLREAIFANALMSTERREFLATRLEYWMQWAQQTPVIKDGVPEHEEYYCE
ncbi:hypothetical protein WME75_29515 [Sorangium sp. So ce1014]|uniref:hypothetical protein n=1 Tax=Sorangium sp. So ce1014 TaxID=3133326 RepID=UPI003F6023EC